MGFRPYRKEAYKFQPYKAPNPRKGKSKYPVQDWINLNRVKTTEEIAKLYKVPRHTVLSAIHRFKKNNNAKNN